MKHLYMYRMTNDSGLAPCVDCGLLTLSCCKGGQIRNGSVVNTGLRHLIGSGKMVDYSSEAVYIMGTYKGKMLYLAKVTDVITMEEYFSGMSDGRTDDIYSLKGNTLVRNNWLRDKHVHVDEDRVIKDIAGKYVLLSDNYMYLGEDAVNIDIVSKYNPKYQETKHYTGDAVSKIVEECLKYNDGKKHMPTTPIIKSGGCK